MDKLLYPIYEISYRSRKFNKIEILFSMLGITVGVNYEHFHVLGPDFFFHQNLEDEDSW